MCWIVWVYSLKHSSEKEVCSLFWSINASDAIIKALKSNKNRWQDGYGISVLKEDNSIDTFRFKDFNSDVVDFLFERKSYILALIWHSRYPTSWGNNTSEALQPFQHNFDKIEENNEMWF